MSLNGNSPGSHLCPPTMGTASLLGQREAPSIFSVTHKVAPKLHIKSSPTDSGFKAAIRIVVYLLYLNAEITIKLCGNPLGLILK